MSVLQWCGGSYFDFIWEGFFHNVFKIVYDYFISLIYNRYKILKYEGLAKNTLKNGNVFAFDIVFALELIFHIVNICNCFPGA